MKERSRNFLDIEVDKLTNSIENCKTGESFETELERIFTDDIKLIAKSSWMFDWHREVKDQSRQVYKLSTVNNRSVIQGLMSIEEKDDHIFLHLLESAKFNKGRAKMYLGVPGNLVAFACQLSFDNGYNGFVAFDSKSTLIEHYKKTLGAIQLNKQRMYIDNTSASHLVLKYFKKKAL